jgi:predicted RNA methylase
MFISTALAVSAWVAAEVLAVEVDEEELQLPRSKTVTTAKKVDKAVFFIKSDVVSHRLTVLF